MRIIPTVERSLVAYMVNLGGFMENSSRERGTGRCGRCSIDYTKVASLSMVEVPISFLVPQGG